MVGVGRRRRGRRTDVLRRWRRQAESRGYRVQRESLRISFIDSLPMWRFWVVALDRARAAAPDLLAEDMATHDGVASFSIAPVRY